MTRNLKKRQRGLVRGIDLWVSERKRKSKLNHLFLSSYNKFGFNFNIPEPHLF
jgi:hypothetical protein